MRCPLTPCLLKAILVDLPRVAGYGTLLRRMMGNLVEVLQVTSGAEQRGHRVAGLTSVQHAGVRLRKAQDDLAAYRARPTYLGPNGFFAQTPPTATDEQKRPLVVELCQSGNFEACKRGTLAPDALTARIVRESKGGAYLTDEEDASGAYTPVVPHFSQPTGVLPRTFHCVWREATGDNAELLAELDEGGVEHQVVLTEDVEPRAMSLFDYVREHPMVDSTPGIQF